MKAIIAGATGLVGSELLKLLVEDSAFSEIVVYARRPPQCEHRKLSFIQGELGELNHHGDELKGDVYFCCLGTTLKAAGSHENFRRVDFHGVVSFGRLAFIHKAKKFLVVSSSGADSQSKLFYPRVKGEAEKALKDLKLNSLVFFRPGFLVGERKEIRTTEKMVVSSFGFFRHVMPIKLSKSFFTEVATLTQKMLEEAKSEASGLQIFEARDI